MENQPQNPDELSTAHEVGRPLIDLSGGSFTLFVFLLELPSLILLVHGMGYLIGLPGFEVIVNELGGRQPVGFPFFRFLGTGGLLIPFIVCCWFAIRKTTLSTSAVWTLVTIIGISYVGASIAWWMLITIGVMNRFV